MSRRSLIAEHMLRDQHDERLAKEPSVDRMKRSRSRSNNPSPPRLPTCYLCRNQFGHASIRIHQDSCYVKHLLRWERDDPETRGLRPLSPEEYEHVHGPIEATFHALSATSSQQRRQHIVPHSLNGIPCPTCCRIYHPDEMRQHLEFGCKPRSSSRSGRAIARQRSPPAIPPPPPSSARIETSFNSFLPSELGLSAPAGQPQQRPVSGLNGSPRSVGVRPSGAQIAVSSTAALRPRITRYGRYAGAASRGNGENSNSDSDDDGLEYRESGPSLTRLDRSSNNNSNNNSRHRPNDAVDDDSARNTDRDARAHLHEFIGLNSDVVPKPASVVEAEKLFPQALNTYAKSSSAAASAAAVAGTRRPVEGEMDPELAKLQQEQQQQSQHDQNNRSSPNNIRMTLAQRAAADCERCRYCFRSFAPDRIDKHEKVCTDRYTRRNGSPTISSSVRRASLSTTSASPRRPATPPAATPKRTTSPVAGSPRPKRPAILNNPISGPGSSNPMTLPTSSNNSNNNRGANPPCKSCGESLVGAAKFCASCGMKVE